MTTTKLTHNHFKQLYLVLYIYKLLLYFNSTVINNQIKYYLTTNRGKFLQMQDDFYMCALQIHNWPFVETACT